MATEKHYNSIPIPKDINERPSEDDLAREALGGVKGDPNLPSAPLTKKEKEQDPIKDEPEHPW
jgi:hypothetical protein